MMTRKHLISRTAVFGLATCGALLQAGPLQAQVVTPVQQQSPPPISSPSADGRAANTWLGADTSGGAVSMFGGGTVALNGHLYEDGVLIRGSFGAGSYEAGSTPIALRDVKFYSGSLLVGYQRNFEGLSIVGYAGPEIVHNGKGASANVRGTEWAGRVIGEMFVPGKSVDMSLWTTYTTFENQYYVQARALYHEAHAGGIGPEAAVFGGDGWHRERLGIRASVPLSIGELGVSGGHQWNNKSGTPFYVNIILTGVF